MVIAKKIVQTTENGPKPKLQTLNSFNLAKTKTKQLSTILLSNELKKRSIQVDSNFKLK